MEIKPKIYIEHQWLKKVGTIQLVLAFFPYKVTSRDKGMRSSQAGLTSHQGLSNSGYTETEGIILHFYMYISSDRQKPFPNWHACINSFNIF